MSAPLSCQLPFDDDDGAEDADDFDIDFDEDYENLSEEEFEVVIEYDEYEANGFDVPSDDFCLDDDIDGFVDFDAIEDTLTAKDYAEEG